MIKNLIVGLGLISQALSINPVATPTIVDNRNETFTVSFAPGAVWACTVFRMTKPTEKDNPNFPDGHYSPRHCWGLPDGTVSYEDNWAHILRYDADWDVYAEVGYPKNGEIVYVESNRVRAHR